jgi:hypothetical protein
MADSYEHGSAPSDRVKAENLLTSGEPITLSRKTAASNFPSKLRGCAVTEMLPRTWNCCRAAGIFQFSL